jgi:thiamine biosynthesis lipoprotein
MRSSLVQVLLVLALAGCATQPATQTTLTHYEFEKPEMGVPFRIVLYASGQPRAEDAAKAAFARVEQLNNIFSDYEFDSELSALSRSAGKGQAVKVSPELWHVLSRAHDLARESGGAFDITVGPFVSLWRKARREQKMPDAAKLEAAGVAVGWEKLRLDPKNRSAELLVSGMRLDLGGIAKGYALDQALQVLRARKISQALVSGGGDLVVGDPPNGKGGWRVELPPLDASNAPPAQFVELRNAALSTSGDLYQRLEIDGKRYSHIVDPRTGIGLTDHSLVTVIAPDGITADSLTKVGSILPPETALKFMQHRRGVAVRIVRKPADKVEVFQSASFKRHFAHAMSSTR